MTLRIKTASENAEVDYSLTKLLDMPNGLERLATEKLPPFIRETRDYESFARKILFVHQVTEADTFLINGEPYIYYPKDMRSHAAMYAQDGEVAQLMIEGDGVNTAIFTISSDDTIINLKRLMVQKYNYIERVRELSGQAIGMVEDKKLIALMEVLFAANTSQVFTSSSASGLVRVDLVELGKTITQWDLPISAYVMHPFRLEDILKWNNTDYDELTRREVLETGVRYMLWGRKLVTSRAIDMKVVYVFSEREFVGRMPVLKDLTTKLTELPNKLEKGLFIFEFLGMYLASHKTIGKMTLP